MASSSRRRARAQIADDEEDEEISRQSTPASTAPYDGKRARHSLESDVDEQADVSSHAPVKTTSKAKSNRMSDAKSVLTNGVRNSQPKHQPGAIVRVKLTNFVTYTAAEFFPGPNLNMVIGPNGTGKSTLVCAICLGLGWGTQYLGRAKDAAEFVKHGCREANIEIELQRATRGPNATRSNPIITRTIKREGNKSTYTLNGQNATGKVVMQLARSFDIQIDNLCQFLPQDKVVEFAQMTPIEILQSTQRAAAPPHMIEMHEQLKALRQAQKESNNNKKNDRDMLTNLENRQEMQRTEVERMRERATVQRRLTWLERCRPVPQYAEAKLRRQEAKQKQKAVSAELNQLKEEIGPTLKKVEAKRVYVKKVKEHKDQREKDVKAAEKECDRLTRSIENHDTTMKDYDHMEDAEKKSMPSLRGDLSRSRAKVAQLKKQKEQEPEPFDSRTMNQEIQDRVTRSREIDSRIDEVRSKAAELKQQGSDRSRRGKELQQRLEKLNTVVGQQEDALKSKSKDAHRAWAWIKDNRELFKKSVYGPPMVECTLKDPSYANRIEALLQQNDFRIFTVQCKEDFRLLQTELIEKQRMHDVSIRTCPIESLDSFKPPLSSEQMQQYGLKGWAIDFLEGPTPVLAMLCQEKFLHQSALTDTDISQTQHDQLSVIPAVKNYVSNAKVYQFVRRAEYGAAGISARERMLRKAEIWINQPTNTGLKQQIEAEIRELQADIHEVRSHIPRLKAQNEELLAEQEKVKEELKQIKAEKDQKQKALVEYNGLDTKISQEQQKIVKFEEDISSMTARLQENKQKKDEAMFAKADAVLKYCDAVHELQLKTKALLEIEVAYIEAHNDFEVLRQRNDSIVKMLQQKHKEEQEAVDAAVSEGQRARELMEEVKKLRDQGIELGEKENDHSLSEVLEELSAMQDPKETDLEDMIKVEEAKLELTEGGDTNTIKEFEERAKKIEQLQSRLTRMSAKQQELLDGIREVRANWEPPLDALVAKISDAFSESFARIGCAGQVIVHKASSDDPADCTDNLGGSDNGLDFANWAIHISVKFRENEALSLLDSHRQSGGERAVSTIFYLMALQSLSRAPFRVVDEINQGMDPRNERMVHGRMVDIAAADENGVDKGSQYFLITPKLLSGLKYKAGMTVLCIVSGENMPSAIESKSRDETGKWVTKPGKRIDFAEFARTARRLGLHSGSVGDTQHQPSSGTSLDPFETRARTQALVGA